MNVFPERLVALKRQAYAATTTTGPLKSGGHDGLRIIRSPITGVAGTAPTLDIAVQIRHQGTNTWFTPTGWALAQAAANDANAVELTILPGIAAVANRAVNNAPGYEVRIVATIGGTTPTFTFGVEYEWIP